jgi:predicted enzyme related to lactoylglutathione lyase
MSFDRRQAVKILTYSFGSSCILPANKLAMAAQNSAQAPAGAAAKPTNPANSDAKHEDIKHQSKGTAMEKVAGIGGLFFRARDPKALGKWYEQHLGIALTPTSEGGETWQQEAGPTAFSPFPETTKYFGDQKQAWMVNFRVHDMAKMVAQLRAAGIEVKDPESYPGVGSFTRLHDPEGNPIELWQVE